MTAKAGGILGRREAVIILLAAIVAAGGIVAWFLFFRPSVDLTETVREFDSSIVELSRKNGLIEKELPREQKFKTMLSRWLRVERSYWYPPAVRRSRIVAEASAAGEKLGLKSFLRSTGPSSWAVTFKDAKGRLLYRLLLRRKMFAAVVIDDVGYNMRAIRRLAALPCRITCTILPLTPHSKAAARILAAGGKEIFIHMPMQPDYEMAEVREYSIALKPGLQGHEVGLCLEKALEDIPAAKGLNNHEGSVATQDRDLMAPLMAFLRERNLVFLDSVTNRRTVAWRMAREAGVRWAKRDVFLDSARSEDKIREYFWKLVAKAKEEGQAVGIGHVYDTTLTVLESDIPKAIKQGVEFVNVSSLAAGGE